MENLSTKKKVRVNLFRGTCKLKQTSLHIFRQELKKKKKNEGGSVIFSLAYKLQLAVANSLWKFKAVKIILKLSRETRGFHFIFFPGEMQFCKINSVHVKILRFRCCCLVHNKKEDGATNFFQNRWMIWTISGHFPTFELVQTFTMEKRTRSKEKW